MRRIIDRLRRALPGARFCLADPNRRSALRQAGGLDRGVDAGRHLRCGRRRRGGCHVTRPCHDARRRFGGRSCPRRRHHQASHRLLEIGTVRADARWRRNLAQAGQPGRLLAILGQHHLRGRGHVQARQRHFPQGLGFGAVVDAGVRRARADLQRPRLPELPSEGRARPPAGGLGRRDLDVPAPGPAGRDGRGEGGRRRPPGAELSRPGLWRAIAGPCRAGAARRRQDGDQLRRAAGDAEGRHGRFRCASPPMP